MLHFLRSTFPLTCLSPCCHAYKCFRLHSHHCPSALMLMLCSLMIAFSPPATLPSPEIVAPSSSPLPNHASGRSAYHVLFTWIPLSQGSHVSLLLHRSLDGNNAESKLLPHVHPSLRTDVGSSVMADDDAVQAAANVTCTVVRILSLLLGAATV